MAIFGSSSIRLPVNLIINRINTRRQARQAAGQVQSAFNGLNLQQGGMRRFRQSLGRITGRASEFQKSMDAATARVFAFGAAAGVLNVVSQSFQNLVKSTIEVEKRLVEINSIFGGTTRQMNSFRNAIFQVAKETGNTFDQVADGAAELARQGLNAEQTAKRLNAALVLTRISGLDAVSSVNALTAAINGYTASALRAEEIVNKIVAVDTAFAVSAKDLADGFQRAGSTAQDAGVNFNELLGIITAVQQTTSRGGAVIGNALKSIFTRLSRSTTIGALQELGVQIDASQTGIQKLNALAAALDQIADPTKASKIKELAGGVFQINVVSAALKDLSKSNSLFQQASQKAASASNEAFAKNAELAKTMSAQINELTVNFVDLASKIGQITLSPIIQDILSLANTFTSKFSALLDPESGNKLVQGFFKGIGKFVSGPGVVLITGAIVKVFKLVAKFAKDGLQEIFRIGTAQQRILDIEQGILQLLSEDENLRIRIGDATVSTADKQRELLQVIRQQNDALQDQKTLTTDLAKGLAGRGITGFDQTKSIFTTKGGRAFARGYEPRGGERRQSSSSSSFNMYSPFSLATSFSENPN